MHKASPRRRSGPPHPACLESGLPEARPVSTPVGWFPGSDGSWLIVASAGGSARNPDWYCNLAAHPDQVQIAVDGRHVAVTAEQLHGTERDEAWHQITTAAPRFAQYQVKTDRELPVIRLAPRSGPDAPKDAPKDAPTDAPGE